MSLPPHEDEWVAVYLRHHRQDAGLRAVRALYRALEQARDPTTRELAEEARVDQRTAGRVIERLVELGLLSAHGGVPIAGGGRTRRTYQTHWPPGGQGGRV
jgi:predicted ArsR family transcriptional regulator